MALLKYDISIIGAEKVNAALGTIEKRFAEHNRKMNAALGPSLRSGGLGGASSTRAQAQSDRAQERATAKALADSDRAAKAAVRATEKAEREKTRIIEREAKERARIETREAKKSQQESDRHERAVTRSRAEWQQRTMGMARGAAGTVASIGRAGLALTGLSGGALAANAVHAIAKESGAATGLAVQLAGRGATAAEIRRDAAGIRKSAGGVYGMATADVLTAQSGFAARTGDKQAMLAMTEELAALSQASGANANDVFLAAGSAFSGLRGKGLKGPELQKQTLEFMRTMTGQGNVGAIELRDIAANAPEIVAAASAFGGDASKNMAMMGAIAQTSMELGGAGSAAEASTAVARFSTDVMSPTAKAKMRKYGVGDVWTDASQTELKGPDAILENVISSTRGNQAKLNDIFGERSAKAVRGFSTAYNVAYKDTNGTKEEKDAAGREAIRSQMGKYMGVSLSEDDVKERAKATREGLDATIAENFKKLNEVIGVQLLPKVLELVPKIGEMAPKIGDAVAAFTSVVEFFAKNPFAGLSLVVGGAIAKEMIAAKVGATIEKFLLDVAPAGKGAASSLDATAAAGSKVSATFGNSLLPALASFGVAFGATTALLEAFDKGQQKRSERGAGIGNDIVARLRSGEITTDQAQKELQGSGIEQKELFATQSAIKLEKTARVAGALSELPAPAKADNTWQTGVNMIAAQGVEQQLVTAKETMSLTVQMQNLGKSFESFVKTQNPPHRGGSLPGGEK